MNFPVVHRVARLRSDNSLRPNVPRRARWTAAALPAIVAWLVTGVGLPTVAATQEPYNYGAAWRSFTANERHLYLSGMREGSLRMLGVKWFINGKVRIADENAAALRRSPLSAVQRRVVDQLIDAQYARVDTEPFGLDATADVMTELYGDRGNALLRFDSILEVAVMKLGGASPREIEEWLGVLRAAQRQYPAK